MANVATRSAIRRFQKEKGLPVNGIAGPDIENALLAATSAPSEPQPEVLQSEISYPRRTAGNKWKVAHDGAGARPERLAKVPGIETTSPAFRQKVIHIARWLGTDPNFLMAIMSFESGLDPRKKNPYSDATGLIQFMPKTAIRLGTTVDALARMSAESQLHYVKTYFAPYRGRLKSLEDAYMAVLWPKAIGRGKDYVLFSHPSTAYAWNKALDLNRDGKITVAEATSFVRKRLNAGSAHPSRSPSTAGSSRSSSNYIRWVQRALNRIMGLRLTQDGISGPATRSAIRSFQSRYGLAVDGVVGTRSEAKLISLGAGTPPPVGRSVSTVPADGGFPQAPSPGPLPTRSTGVVSVTVGTNARISDNAIAVLRNILSNAGLTHATITSGRRTSADQARIMYNLINREGIDYAKNLYGRYGDQVIDVYDAMKRSGSTPTAIKNAMEEKIKTLGCHRVSHHCSDAYDVFDVGPRSIADQNAFRRALKAALERGVIDKYITPPEDPAYHIEIKLKSSRGGA